jgi:hypothetical protein
MVAEGGGVEAGAQQLLGERRQRRRDPPARDGAAFGTGALEAPREARIAAREQRRVGALEVGRRRARVREPCALAREAVEDRGGGAIIASDAEMVGAQAVDGDDEDAASRAHAARLWAARERQAREAQEQQWKMSARVHRLGTRSTTMHGRSVLVNAARGRPLGRRASRPAGRRRAP